MSWNIRVTSLSSLVRPSQYSREPEKPKDPKEVKKGLSSIQTTLKSAKQESVAKEPLFHKRAAAVPAKPTLSPLAPFSDLDIEEFLDDSEKPKDARQSASISPSPVLTNPAAALIAARERAQTPSSCAEPSGKGSSDVLADLHISPLPGSESVKIQEIVEPLPVQKARSHSKKKVSESQRAAINYGIVFEMKPFKKCKAAKLYRDVVKLQVKRQFPMIGVKFLLPGSPNHVQVLPWDGTIAIEKSDQKFIRLTFFIYGLLINKDHETITSINEKAVRGELTEEGFVEARAFRQYRVLCKHTEYVQELNAAMKGAHAEMDLYGKDIKNWENKAEFLKSIDGGVAYRELYRTLRLEGEKRKTQQSVSAALPASASASDSDAPDAAAFPTLPLAHPVVISPFVPPAPRDPRDDVPDVAPFRVLPLRPASR